jgi:hypothetical protein
MPKKRKFVPLQRKMFPAKNALPPRVSKFLRAGQQTKITGAVRGYASLFPGNSLETVEKIVKDISRFKRKHLPIEELKKVYAKRTAAQILKDRWIAVIGGQNRMAGQYSAVAGCLDYNTVLCSALRAKGIPAKFVRDKLHSTTFFYLNGNWFEADPSVELTRRLAKAFLRKEPRLNLSSIPGSVIPVSGSRLRYISEGKQLGYAAEGTDAWAIGIKSLKDFGKYNPAR